MMMRVFKLFALVSLFTLTAFAQEAPAPPAKAWNYSFSMSGYLVQDSTSFGQPVFTADRKWLHLEGRYNYEALDTGSAFVGYNFSVGKKVEFSATPIIGAVFGSMSGAAPGYELSLTYKRLSLSTDGEYVFFTNDRSSNYFYSWSQLSYSPKPWFSFGLVSQKTKLYQTRLNVQRGFLLGFTRNNTSFTGYVFNAGWTDPMVVFTLSQSF